MRYKPDLGYTYPEKTDQHMLKVPHLVDTNFDENYRYFDDTKWFRFKRWWLNIALNIFGYPLVKLKHGLIIKGRKEFLKNKKNIKNGAITICNHVFMWDYLCVMSAIRPIMEYHIAWPINFEGPNRNLIKIIGGVPIPSKLRALARFDMSINKILDKKIWLHVFPEGSMWYYYPNIRPIKKGTFNYAYKHNIPVIPLAISFRKPTGIYKFLGYKKPLATITIGDPEYPNMELEKKDSIVDLQKRCYEKMQLLAGITKDDPDFNSKVFEEIKDE